MHFEWLCCLHKCEQMTAAHKQVQHKQVQHSSSPLCAGVALEDAPLLAMSTLTEEGVMAVKTSACDRLLATRVEAKLQVPPAAAAAVVSIWGVSAP